MAKIKWKPGNMLYPLPVVMVSCGDTPENYNIVTVAWTGIVNTNPPMCYISLRKIRHSYDIIKNTGQFVINLTNEALAHATDWCGVNSGKVHYKFSEMKLIPVPGDIVNCPMIDEAPVNLECVVKSVTELGSHDMFLAEIVAVHVNENYVDTETDTLNLTKAKLIAYSHGKYYKLGDEIGKFGYSVARKKTKERWRKSGGKKN